MTEAQVSEHNRAYKKAMALSRGELLLHERMHLPVPGWWTSRKLRRAIVLLERVIALNPSNWNAMWVLGKIHQRYKKPDQALPWFERAYQINPSQPDVARETSLCAMSIGNHDAAITYAFRSCQINPNDGGLHANLALAYLLAGRVPEAQQAITRALEVNSTDKISLLLQDIVQHFAANNQTPPKTPIALEKYWKANKSKE